MENGGTIYGIDMKKIYVGAIFTAILITSLIIILGAIGCQTKNKEPEPTSTEVPTEVITDDPTEESTTDLVEVTEVLPTEEPTMDPQIEYDAIILAKLLAREADLEVVKSTTERACVIWTVLNRVDKYGTSVEIEVTKPHQFAWNPETPVRDEHFILACDVLMRWYYEKETGIPNGRVLPADYLFFYGDGWHNHFFQVWGQKDVTWDYSLPSPYAD